MRIFKHELIYGYVNVDRSLKSISRNVFVLTKDANQSIYRKVFTYTII